MHKVGKSHPLRRGFTTYDALDKVGEYVAGLIIVCGGAIVCGYASVIGSLWGLQ